MSPLADIFPDYVQDEEKDHEIEQFESRLEIMKEAMINDYRHARELTQARSAQILDDQLRDSSHAYEALGVLLNESKRTNEMLLCQLSMKNSEIERIGQYLLAKARVRSITLLFTRWKSKFIEGSYLKVVLKMSRNRRLHLICRNAWNRWQSKTQEGWKARLGKEMEERNSELISAMREAHLKEISTLSDKHEVLKADFHREHEQLKTAFLRSVSALNAEAVGLLKEPPIHPAPIYLDYGLETDGWSVRQHQGYRERDHVSIGNGLITRHLRR